MTETNTTIESARAGQDPPRQRRGCSCTTCVLYLIFLFAIVTFGGWMAAQWFARQFITEGMTPAQVADFEKWLDEPIALPAEFTVRHEPDSPEMTKLKEEASRLLSEHHTDLQSYNYSLTQTSTSSLSGEAFAEMERLRKKEDHDYYGTYYNNNTEEDLAKYLLLSEKIAHNLPLNEDEKTSRALILQQSEKIINRLHEIVSRPDYVGNTRGLVPEQNLSYYNETMTDVAQLFRTNNQTSNSLLALRTALLFEHTDPEFAMVSTRLNTDFFAEIREGSDATSDVETLRSYLALMLDYDKAASVQGADRMMVDSRIIRLPALWQQYVPGARMPQSRRDYLDFELSLDSIMKPIWENMPKTDPRHEEITPDKFGDLVSMIPLEHQAGMSIGAWTGNRYADRLLLGLGRPVIRLGMRTYAYYTQAQQFPHLESSLETPYRNTLAHARLLAIHLAARIAVLTGEPAPTDVQTLVPGVLPAAPTDPFTEQPMGYSAEKGVFISAGPDKVPGTADDITLETPVDEEYGVGWSGGFI